MFAARLYSWQSQFAFWFQVWHMMMHLKSQVRICSETRMPRQRWQGDNNKHTLCFIFHSSLSIFFPLPIVFILPFCCLILVNFLPSRPGVCYSGTLNGVNCGYQERKKTAFYLLLDAIDYGTVTNVEMQLDYMFYAVALAIRTRNKNNNNNRKNNERRGKKIPCKFLYTASTSNAKVK